MLYVALKTLSRHFKTFSLLWIFPSSKSDLHVIFSFKCFSPLSDCFLPLPHSYPLPSFFLSSILVLFISPHTPLLASSFLARPSVLPSRRGRVVTIVVTVVHSQGRAQDRVVEHGHHHHHHCHHQADEESQTWALSVPIRLADSHKLISYSLHSSIIHRPKEPWEAGGCKGPSPHVVPNCSTKTHPQRSVSSPYHQCPPSASESMRQLVIMPLAITAMCRCHVSHGEVKVGSSRQRWHDGECVNLGTVWSYVNVSIKSLFVVS